jgi:hypothetical protein
LEAERSGDDTDDATRLTHSSLTERGPSQSPERWVSLQYLVLQKKPTYCSVSRFLAVDGGEPETGESVSNLQ